MPTLTKCLIANRGEIAVRIIRACHERGIATVAVYSQADAAAWHAQLADEAVLIGPASATQSYLDATCVIDAAQQTGCDCLHPGYGFLSESADFAQAVGDAGLTWIGPLPHTIRAMGDKTAAREQMQAAGVPVVPGYRPSADEALPAMAEAARAVGYPLMIKAAGGGGGRGMRIVREPANLTEAISAARSEAERAFGDGRIFIERYIENARHIEVQVLADSFGHTIHLGERDCSVQRRHQKIVEEAPSPVLDAGQRADIGMIAVQAARAVDYRNAGTVEFILTPAGDFYFLEMNTRLQVEHPVTEMVTGIDLVQWQLAIAAGERLTVQQDDVSLDGHAIECRIYAEDASRGFLPASGTIRALHWPDAPGIRVDGGVCVPATVSACTMTRCWPS